MHQVSRKRLAMSPSPSSLQKQQTTITKVSSVFSTACVTMVFLLASLPLVVQADVGRRASAIAMAVNPNSKFSKKILHGKWGMCWDAVRIVQRRARVEAGGKIPTWMRTMSGTCSMTDPNVGYKHVISLQDLGIENASDLANVPPGSFIGFFQGSRLIHAMIALDNGVAGTKNNCVFGSSLDGTKVSGGWQTNLSLAAWLQKYPEGKMLNRRDPVKIRYRPMSANTEEKVDTPWKFSSINRDDLHDMLPGIKFVCRDGTCPKCSGTGKTWFSQQCEECNGVGGDGYVKRK